MTAGPVARRLGLLNGASADAANIYIEAWPTSPLIKTPFVDPLPIPQALRPVPQSVWSTWRHWQTGQPIVPGPGPGQQDDMGQTHQIWPSSLTYQGKPLPDPLIYQIKLQLGLHQFTSSDVLPINSNGQPSFYFKNGQQIPVTADSTGIKLPGSVGYTFNGTFPGPRVRSAVSRRAPSRVSTATGPARVRSGFLVRASMPSTASRSSCASRTTSTRTA